MLLKKINNSWCPDEYRKSYGRDMQIGETLEIGDWRELVRLGMAIGVDDQGNEIPFQAELIPSHGVMALALEIGSNLVKRCENNVSMSEELSRKTRHDKLLNRLNMLIDEARRKIEDQIYAEVYEAGSRNPTG